MVFDWNLLALEGFPACGCSGDGFLALVLSSKDGCWLQRQEIFFRIPPPEALRNFFEGFKAEQTVRGIWCRDVWVVWTRRDWDTFGC